MSDYNPPKVLVAISKIKYRKALIPLIVVIAAFLAQITTGYMNLRYVSLIALAYYLSLILLFRVNRCVVNHEAQTVVSPINGKICKIESGEKETVISINKAFYQAADLRFSSDFDLPDPGSTHGLDSALLKTKKISFTIRDNLIKWSLQGNSIYYFPHTSPEKGVLTGIIPGNSLCLYKVAKRIFLQVQMGDRVEAGVTVIGLIK